MSLGTYRVFASDVLPSQSGNAIIAIYNKADSNKRVYIKNVEIQNFRRDAIGTSSQTVTDYEFQRITAQTTGDEITPVKLDTNASNIPSQIKFYKGGNPTYDNLNLTISTTGNLTFGAGPPGTVTRASGSWLTDGIIPQALVTFSGTTGGLNDRTFKVRSTTATVITLEAAQTITTQGATGGITTTAVVPHVVKRVATKHNLFAATTNSQFNISNTGRKDYKFGTMLSGYMNKGGNVEPITLAAGEGLSMRMRNTLDVDTTTMCKEFHTFYLECTFTLDWSPDKTYFVADYITPNGEDSPLFSIMNNSGSGRILKIYDLSMAEIGDISTPYFMVVPFESIEPLHLTDAARNLSYTKYDTDYDSIDSYVDIKKDVSLFPSGFSSGNPLFPLNFGSALPGLGLNYLITKDFQGSIYSVFFPEKSDLTCNPQTTVTNQVCSKSQRHSTQFTGNDLFLRPGEGIAIVAAAEPLAGVAAASAQQVNKFSMGKYDYSITFSMTEDILPTLTLTGLQSSSEVRIFTHGTTTELAGIENSGTSFSWQYTYAASTYVDIVIMHLNYQYYRIENLLLTSSDTSIPVQQIADRVYTNP